MGKREPCMECGDYFDTDEMSHAGCDDDGMEMFDMWICDTCNLDSQEAWGELDDAN